MKKVIEAVGFISGLITIIDWIKNLISGSKFLSPVGVRCLSIFVFCLFFLVFLYKKRTRYTIFKYFSHYFRRPNLPYYLKEKEIIYTYKSLQEMSYQKKITLVSKVDGFSSFKGKFRWSKPQELSKFNVSCLSPHNKLTLGRDTTWNTYTVEFTPAPKGSMRVVDILVDDLKDPGREAVPFCSASIVEHTEMLNIKINLEGDLQFALDSIKFLVYNNAASTFPILEETYSSSSKHSIIECDREGKHLSIKEKFPVFGYKYQISWDFK